MDSRAQLDTAQMHPAQHDRGKAGVNQEGCGRGKILAKIHFPAHDTLFFGRRCKWHVADVGEALLAQEIVEDVQRREAGIPGDLRKPQRGRLGRSLLRQCWASAHQRRRPGKARGCNVNAGFKKMPSGWHRRAPSAA